MLKGHQCVEPAASLPDRVARLETLAEELARKPNIPFALMREHLDAARFYLTASMPQELAFTLSLASELLPKIDDRALRARLADFLHSEEELLATLYSYSFTPG